MVYDYRQVTEIWEVGYIDSNGGWQAIEDGFKSKLQAIAFIHFLNGGSINALEIDLIKDLIKERRLP